ncbi:putative pentatricopeptide repeat domain-containing protein 3, mitochondrial [Apostichopus japonicus]|uniref:Small ribosomal subunit protein mS39 n=1 Tax=Stichopus japonicus TaxID=307972 RepID=A0A2G8LEP5_STIJA|nr:putative pentatricopeptide repeat domain-containing protein 3, mitochondrial [Apostichopus japonicus]
MATPSKFSCARNICKLCLKFPLSKNSSRFYVHATSGIQNTVQKTDELESSFNKLVIPKRKKRDDLAVLRALSETVGKDSTASPYGYHDDPFLLPKTPMERKRYLLAAESGRKAAQLVIRTKPDVFLAHQNDEPKIEAYYPPNKTYIFTDPSEDGIMERLDQLDFKSACDMHKELIDSGKEVGLDVSNALLDALCYYNSQPPLDVIEFDKPPAKEEGSDNNEEEKQEEVAEAIEPPAPNEKQIMKRWIQDTWKEGEENMAQVLFESLKEPDSHSYNAMIRGMVKHGAHGKAFNLFNKMQEKGIQTSLQGYNALISAVTSIRTDYKDRWEVLVQLLKQMQAENIRPNVLTFNNLLNSLRLMEPLPK